MENQSVNKIFKCSECGDTGMVKEKNGSVHTCWTCLANGRLDAHSKNMPSHNLKL